MFQTLSNVQSGEALHLQQCIDNSTGNLCAGLRSITYTVGWYNIEEGEIISWRSESGGRITSHSFAPGLYNFTQFRNKFRRLGINTSVDINRLNGLITLHLPSGWQMKFTDGLLNLLGLEDGLNGKWLDAGTYTGDYPANFATINTLYVHLEQLSDTNNRLNGAPSQLLAVIPVTRPGVAVTVPSRFGDIYTVRFEQLELKHLQVGYLSELKVTITDENGMLLNNHGLPISVVLEFKKQNETAIYS